MVRHVKEFFFSETSHAQCQRLLASVGTKTLRRHRVARLHFRVWHLRSKNPYLNNSIPLFPLRSFITITRFAKNLSGEEKCFDSVENSVRL